jgi:hypothetical protein
MMSDRNEAVNSMFFAALRHIGLTSPSTGYRVPECAAISRPVHRIASAIWTWVIHRGLLKVNLLCPKMG